MRRARTLPVIHCDPIGIKLRHCIGGSGVERRRFPLGSLLDEAIEFGGGRLIEARFLFEAEEPNGFEQSERSYPIDIGGIFRGFETDRDVALRAEVVDFVRLNL